VDVLEQFFNFRLLVEWREALLEGLLTTLALAAVTLAVSLLPAILLAIVRIYGPRPVAGAAFVVVSVVRSIPAVVLIVFVFFGLPEFGILLSPFLSVVGTLAAVQIVYFSEVFRGALLSVGKGQFEAAYSCGLRPWQTYRYAILPQAFTIAAPAFASSLIQLVQNTTVASVTSSRDIVGVALDVQASTGSPAPWLPVTCLFLILLLPLARVVRHQEERMARAREPVPAASARPASLLPDPQAVR
jgi:His/Glu/Gln/Arg/opine family amino acid ABC transporter permease subunit